MAQEPNLFPLKLLVIFLGVALAGGIIFVLSAIAVQMKTDLAANHCPDAVLHLNGMGTVTGITPQGTNVQVVLASGHDSKVLTVDRCTGHVLQTLTVAP